MVRPLNCAAPELRRTCRNGAAATMESALVYGAPPLSTGVEHPSYPHARAPRPVTKGSVHLDALRGGAALLVFMNHTRALYFSSIIDQPTPGATVSIGIDPVAHPATATAKIPFVQADPLAGHGIKLASEAVVIFFVLSGYLVGGSTLRAMRLRNWSWKNYLIKRMTRLWVPLIPCLLLCVFLDRTGYRFFGEASIYHNPPGIGLVTATDLVHRLGVTTVLGNIFFLQNIRVWYLGTDVSLWSLANEFWYYMIFPCLALAFTAGRSILLRVLYLVLAAAMLVFITPSVAILFPVWVLGAVVAILPKPLSSPRAGLLSLVGLPVLFFCMIKARLLFLPMVVVESLIGLLASAFLYLLVQQREMTGRSLYRSLAGYFSQISYTLYIVHVPLAIFLASSINSPWHRWSKTPAHLALFLILDGMVLACATLLWRLFEANTDSIRLRLFERRPAIAGNPVALP